MAIRIKKSRIAALCLAVIPVLPAFGAEPPAPDRQPQPGRGEDARGGPPTGGAPSGGGGMRPPGMGGPGFPERALVKQFDKDADGRLNAEERQAARKTVKEERAASGRGWGRGPGMRPNMQAGKPGPRVSPEDVKNYPEAGLYEPSVLRTIFINFEEADWEAEMDDFRNTDVDVPAMVTVDGKKYSGVGVRFRGASSLFSVPLGSKRSLNLAFDHADDKQRLYGCKTLNLLNGHDDSSFLHTVMYSHIARQYIPAPKANLVKVVINGESWGIYASAQQFDKIFTQENFGSDKGARWKTPGNPRGAASLAYLGEKAEDYKRSYEIKTADNEKSWKALIALCRTLEQTPPDKLEKALEPMLDVDGALWFLAIENALMNDDGYWVRTSDYCIYLDEKGKFHFIPHDMNEDFRPGGGGPGGRRGPGGQGGQGGPPGGGGGGGNPNGAGPGGQGGPPGGPGNDGPPGAGPQGGGPQGDAPPREGPPGNGPDGQQGGPRGGGQQGGGSRGGPGEGGPRGGDLRPFGPPGGGGFGRGGVATQLDPLIAAQDKNKPLISKLLAVPALRERYLQHVRTIASDSLDWQKLGPVATQYHELIKEEVAADTRKLSSMEEFNKSLLEVPGETFRKDMSLQAFAKLRREYLLNHAEIKKLAQAK